VHCPEGPSDCTKYDDLQGDKDTWGRADMTPSPSAMDSVHPSTPYGALLFMRGSGGVGHADMSGAPFDPSDKPAPVTGTFI
jgi:hypothetical protein